MFLGNTNFQISKSRDGWWYAFPNESWVLCDEKQEPYVKEVYEAYRSTKLSDSEKEFVLTTNFKTIKRLESGNEDAEAAENAHTVLTAGEVTSLVEEILKFFSEFSFEPNFRFINTFAMVSQDLIADPRDYITSYFELIDSPLTAVITEKMKSVEFTDIISRLRRITPSKAINKRFKLYYGSQGTGKTTEALKESDGLCMVCHSAMLPQDLMEDFKFNEGKAEFTPSVLQNAIVEGKPITLDEINLLPFESLRFLQSILDGKESFNYKGNIIKVADGFKIIGTMNLVVNGCVYSLPEPLIDRAENLKKFELTASQLVGALS